MRYMATNACLEAKWQFFFYLPGLKAWPSLSCYEMGWAFTISSNLFQPLFGVKDVYANNSEGSVK